MGRRFPDGGLLRYRKWVPQQLGDVADRQPTNGSAAQRHGSQSRGFAVRVWSNLCICSPGMVELVRTNLGTSFPLFHDRYTIFEQGIYIVHYWKCLLPHFKQLVCVWSGYPLRPFHRTTNNFNVESMPWMWSAGRFFKQADGNNRYWCQYWGALVFQLQHLPADAWQIKHWALSPQVTPCPPVPSPAYCQHQAAIVQRSADLRWHPRSYLEICVGRTTSTRPRGFLVREYVVSCWIVKYTIRSIVREASCHPVTQSFGHLIIQSFSHSVTWSLGH